MERALFDLARIGNISDLARARQWSAAELRGAVVGRHATLDKAGVGPESRVVIAHGGTPEFFADLFAVWAAGACAACVNPDLMPGEIANGILYIMPKPSGEWLDDDINAYSSLGLEKTISLLELSEAEELGLVEQSLHCHKHGIEFVQHPIKDRGLPEIGKFKNLVDEVFGDLDKGMNVAIHCRAGIGRSGVLASCILIRAGFSAEQAISKVGTARGIEIPDTEEQLKFIMNYAAGL